MSQRYLPLYEAKMMHQFDHRYATYEGATEANLNAGILPQSTPEQKADPLYAVEPRYWVDEEEVVLRTTSVPQGVVAAYRAGNASALREWLVREGCSVPAGDADAVAAAWVLLRSKAPPWFVAFRDITSSVVESTAILSLLPRVGVGHTAPLVFLGPGPAPILAAMYANLNTLVFDYTARQKVGGHMTYSVLRQLPVLPPVAYGQDSMVFVVPRVLELTCASWDIWPFANDVWTDADDGLRQAIQQQWEENKAATGGHEWNPPDRAETLRQAQGVGGDGIPLPPFKWDEDRRAVLRAELDAYYARLYGLNRKQLRYILDPHGLSHKELEDILDPWEDPTCSGPHLLPAEPAEDFPGETFRVLKNKEEKQLGEYRTRRLVLEAWAKLEAELGPAQPVNYREMLERERQEQQSAEHHAAEAAGSQRKQEEPADLVLRPSDYSDQAKLKFRE